MEQRHFTSGGSVFMLSIRSKQHRYKQIKFGSYLSLFCPYSGERSCGCTFFNLTDLSYFGALIILFHRCLWPCLKIVYEPSGKTQLDITVDDLHAKSLSHSCIGMRKSCNTCSSLHSCKIQLTRHLTQGKIHKSGASAVDQLICCLSK